MVQERLGHASISETLDRYSHLTPNMQREAADRLDAAIEAAGDEARKQRRAWRHHFGTMTLQQRRSAHKAKNRVGFESLSRHQRRESGSTTWILKVPGHNLPRFCRGFSLTRMIRPTLGSLPT